MSDDTPISTKLNESNKPKELFDSTKLDDKNDVNVSIEGNGSGDFSDSEDIDNPNSYNAAHNYWDTKNTDTVNKLEVDSRKYVFVYNVILEKYKNKVNRALITALIFGAITTILSGISSTITGLSSMSSSTTTDTIFRWVVFSINIILCVLSGIVTGINGIIKIYKWNTIVTDITAFIEKIDAYYITVSSILVIKDKLRPNANNFIKKEYATYLNIMQSKPEVSQSDFVNANKKYEKYIKNNNLYCKYIRGYNMSYAEDVVIE